VKLARCLDGEITIQQVEIRLGKEKIMKSRYFNRLIEIRSNDRCTAFLLLTDVNTLPRQPI
jgi:hypothetical protein